MNLKERFHIKIGNTVKNTAAHKTLAESRARTCARKNPIDLVYIWDTQAPEDTNPYFDINGHRLTEHPYYHGKPTQPLPEGIHFAEETPKKSRKKSTALTVRTFSEVFENVQLTAMLYKDRLVFIAREVEAVLGYEHKSLINLINKEWSSSFQEGIHCIKLVRSELAEFKSFFQGVVWDTTPFATSYTYANSLLLLTEKGFYKVLIRSNKPICEPIQEWVTNVIEEIRKTGSYSLPAVKKDKLLVSQQRAATANVAELRRFIKDGHVGAKQLLQFSKTMWKAVPTCDKEFWRTKIKDSFENCEKFASFKTIMNNFQEYGVVPSFQELVENSRNLPKQLTQGTPITEETDSIRTVTEIPDNYFTVESLSNYVYGSTAPNNIRTVLYALKYHHFDVDSDHCLRVIPIRGEGSLHPFYVYSRRVLNVLQSTKDTRMI